MANLLTFQKGKEGKKRKEMRREGEENNIQTTNKNVV